MLWSTAYIVTPQPRHELIQKAILEEIEKRSFLAGCTALPNESGLVVRMLDDSIDNIEELQSVISAVTRNHVVIGKKGA